MCSQSIPCIHFGTDVRTKIACPEMDLMSAMLPADLLRYIERKFAKSDRGGAVTLLLSAPSLEAVAMPRLQRCALVASDGSLERLMHYVNMLEVDYRDVIVAAECDTRDGELVQVRDLAKPLD